MKINYIISFICVILLFLLVQKNRQLNDANVYFSNVNDSLTIVKDKYNREVATSKILQLEKKELLNVTKLYISKYNLEKSKTNKIKYLQVIETKTIYDSTIKTIVEFKDSLPTYVIKDSSQWHTINVTANADSSNILFSVCNKFITTHYNTAPFWKAPNYTIQTINLNPNTQTKEQLSYNLKPKRANRLLWFGAGLFTTLILTR